jgi:hypothetical protein
LTAYHGSHFTTHRKNALYPRPEGRSFTAFFR